MIKLHWWCRIWGNKKKVIARHKTRGTEYVDIKHGCGGLCTVTTKNGSQHIVKQDSIDYFKEDLYKINE